MLKSRHNIPFISQQYLDKSSLSTQTYYHLNCLRICSYFACFFLQVWKNGKDRDYLRDYPRRNQPWIFTGRTDAEAPILWPPDVKSQLTGKDSDAGKYWGQEKKETEDEMVASLTQWTCVWANSGRWWGTEKPSFEHGVLRSMGWQRVRRDLSTEQQSWLVSIGSPLLLDLWWSADSGV